MAPTNMSAVSDYEVDSLIGEGSFGKVYKAKSRCTNEVVAYKVIGKSCRSASELLTLRRECEIQQHLHHPNIVPMLDSFETENEIVVVTEFVPKGLSDVLKEEKVLSESAARNIISDLVSALYYLHSHRVLHRDLKPQNVLVDVNGVTKLCDFGFARIVNNNMQVLTSIKGTPLYMAPEVMHESHYDHNADLWSLGCIAYEITVGHPPFTTASLLQLIRMIKRDSIVWPNHLSETFLSFLKGLLQKDPSARLSWPHLIHHPFVRDKIRIVEGNPAALAVMSYTTPNIVPRVTGNDNFHYSPMMMMPSDIYYRPHGYGYYGNCQSPCLNGGYAQNFQPHSSAQMSHSNCHCCSIISDHCLKSNYENGATSSPHYPYGVVPPMMPDPAINRLEYQLRDFHLTTNTNDVSGDKSNHVDTNDDEENDNSNDDNDDEEEDDEDDSGCLDSGNGSIETETEEWLEFLKNNMKDVMRGEIECLSEKTFLTMILAVLKNPRVDCTVVGAISKLLALPFVVESVTPPEMDDIRQLYINCNVMQDLLFASKQILLSGNDAPISMAQINEKHLKCLEHVYVLVSNLVFSKDEFVRQFYDCSIKLQMASTFRLLLRLTRHNARIVMDVLTVLLRVIKEVPQSFNLTENIIFCQTRNGKPSMDFHSLLTSNSDTLRIRTCIFIILLVKMHRKEFSNIWQDSLTADLTNLKNSSSSVAPVAKAAESLIRSLRLSTK